MNPKQHTRLFLLAILATASLFVLAYSRINQAPASECTGKANCDPVRAQTDFIIWDSFSHDF